MRDGVYSIRFSADDVRLLKMLAERERMKLVDVIRAAVRQMAHPNAAQAQTYTTHSNPALVNFPPPHVWTTNGAP